MRAIERRDSVDMSEEPSSSEAPRPAQSLFPEVYARLKALAGRELAKVGPGATLNATALVHELYLKLHAGRDLGFSDPGQFLGYAAQAMRHILVDRARARMRHKRGGALRHEDLDALAERIGDASAEQTLALDAALLRLEEADPRASRLVELHYFAGLPLPQVAEVLQVSARTLNRDWRFARAFLHEALG